MIRLSGPGRTFVHGGFDLGSDWTTFESLTDEQHETLRDFHGRFVRVHPDDFDKLTSLGLKLQTDEGGAPLKGLPLVELRPAKKSTDSPTTQQPAKAHKTDAKKEA